MGARKDLIAVVESSYDLAATETQWLQGVAERFQAVLQAENGVIAYHVDLDAQGWWIGDLVHTADAPPPAVEQMSGVVALLAKRRRGEAGLLERARAKLYDRVIGSLIREPADRVLHSEHHRAGPRRIYTLGAPIADTFALVNHHVDRHGFTGIFGGLERPRAFRPGERATFQMLSAHIKAGLRLRRRLPGAARAADVSRDGAVLSPSGRVLHAEGEARDPSAREELSARAAEVDRARTERSGRGEDALAIWQGLVRGRWSLVERFDADGKRFLLAHENAEDVRDPRGLSEIEVRVVGLAVRGYSDKLIAYHLGLPEGTVSSHLTHAMRKLGAPSRIALVRQLGTRYPQRPL